MNLVPITPAIKSTAPLEEKIDKLVSICMHQSQSIDRIARDIRSIRLTVSKLESDPSVVRIPMMVAD